MRVSETKRVSGHEWFPCRYPWLPKAYRLLSDDPTGLDDEDRAVEALGIGKNMVRALKFWATAMRVIERPESGEGYSVTSFGEAVFGADGFDPYLEDIRTLWLLHWHVATADPALFAWDFLLGHWHRPEIVRGSVLPEFIAAANGGSRTYSETTLRQHYDVFMLTYVRTTRTRAGAGEDHLDSPLVELGLLDKVGERTAGKKREPVYAFRREAKPEIPAALFAYALADMWRTRLPDERSLTFRNVATDPGSPGQVFKLPEADLRDRLESIEADSGGQFAYRESAALAQVTRSASVDLSDDSLLSDLLARIYAPTL
ncbi:MAG: DUF4007 family protein [Bacteroidota bacterium]